MMYEEPELNCALPSRMLKHLKQWKNNLFKHWSKDYVQVLQEKHYCYNGTKPVLKVEYILK